ncbi:hypothetical protein C3Y98_05290 [Methylotenera oryzisoli]|uniref:DUF4376 domain-containing protein n=1 Tax=Methylotenera oryzisoli TaxID=2080758 RepID=A0A4Y9VRM2_9PROT|nr:DUF4376 domain-containing protein [Methylotenera oryzisoli]TFW71512.1 hypothetical protein C3Y98_05290 [Methylotenera oryzisoli]
MKAKYSKLTGGVYVVGASKNIPDDALDIPDELYSRYCNAQLNKFDVVNGKVVEYVAPPPTQDELDELAVIQAKKDKLLALNSITVTTSSGKIFDGNETARNNMLSAITAANFIGQTTANWKLADNTIALVTLDEVHEALALSIQRVGEIVTA